jgi:hypothetical protein
MIARTREELSEMTEAERREHFEAEARNVFGHDAKKDPRTGKYIEQGRGSKQQPTIQSMQALRAAEGDDVADAAIEAAKKRGVWPPPDHERF